MKRLKLLFVLPLLIWILWPCDAYADPISLIIGTVGAWGAVAAGTASVAYAVGFTLGSVGILGAMAGVTLGLGALSSKPKQTGLGSFTNKAQNRSQMVRSSVDTHKVVYGRARVSGPIAFIKTRNTSTFKNRIINFIVVLAAHELEEIETIYIDEDPVTLDGDGFVTTSKYLATGNDDYAAGSKIVRIIKHLGADDQSADPVLTNLFSDWTTSHQGKGIAYLHVQIGHSRDRFPNGLPNISAVVKGKPLYDPRTETTGYSNNLALVVRDYYSDYFYGVGASDDAINDDEIITAANLADEKVVFYGDDENDSINPEYDWLFKNLESPITDEQDNKNLTVAGSATFSEEGLTIDGGVSGNYFEAPNGVMGSLEEFSIFQVFKIVGSSSSKDWLATGNGASTSASNYRLLLGTNSSANLFFGVSDGSLDTTTIATSCQTGDTWAVLATYKNNGDSTSTRTIHASKDGVTWVSATETNSTIATVDSSWELRNKRATTSTAGGEAQYQRLSIYPVILSLSDAQALYSANRQKLSLAPRYTANGVLDTADKPADIIKDLTSSGAGFPTYSEGKHGVKLGGFETPSIEIDETWLAKEAGGIDIIAKPARDELFNGVKGVYVEPSKEWAVTDFPAVTNATYLSQDGGVELMQDIELPFVTSSERAQRLAKIVLEKHRQALKVSLACNLKAFRLRAGDNVMLTLDRYGWNQKTFKILSWSIDENAYINLSLQEDSAESYDWQGFEGAVYDTAPDTNLPNALDPDPPGVPTITESPYITNDGSGVKIKATVTWGLSENYYIREYEVFYKLDSASDYTSAGRADRSPVDILDIAPGDYNFKIVAYTELGVSVSSDVQNITIIGLTEIPEDLSGFSVSAIHNQAHLTWTQSVDIDVKVGGSIRIKWYPETTGASWGDATQIVEDLPGITTSAVAPLRAGTYLIKAVDSGGRESENATTAITTVANIVEMVTLASSTQQAGFAGTKTNMQVDGSILELIDPASNGEYLFNQSGDDYIDLGTVLTARLNFDVKFSAVDESGGDFFDLYPDINLFNRPGFMFSGTTEGVTIKAYARFTDDDPSGSPSWTDWIQFLVTDQSFRACQIKIIVSTNSTDTNISISELSATIEEAA